MSQSKGTMPSMKSLVSFGLLVLLVSALWLKQRFSPDPLTECDHAAQR